MLPVMARNFTVRLPDEEATDVEAARYLLSGWQKNHPLLDGTTGRPGVALRVLIESGQWSWSTHPSVDEADTMGAFRYPPTRRQQRPRVW